MNRKKYNQLRIVVSFFVTSIVFLSISLNSYLLSVAGVLTGMIFLIFARVKTKFQADEREVILQEKAAKLAYAIFAPTIGIGAFLLLIPSRSGLSVFSKGEFNYLESLGMILAYLTLFLISIYAISYYFLNHKYGGSSGK